VRVIGSLVVVAVLHFAAFAQKPPDPEARNKQAISVAGTRPGSSVQPHRSHYDAITVPKSGSSSARDLAKIEQSSVQRMKTTHKANNNLKTASALPATKSQTGNKPINFSYQPPKAAAKAATNPPSPASRSPKNH
jgi:hypothetical protein